MLRTNSKKARENIRAYVVANCDFCDYELDKEPETFEDVARAVWQFFNAEYMATENQRRYNLAMLGTWQRCFTEYLAGLPSFGLGDFFYRWRALDDLAKTLEETDEEKARYSENDAEDMLARLIYREITNALGF